MLRNYFPSNRRTFLTGAAAVFATSASSSAEDVACDFYVGTYSSDKGKGIYPLKYTPTTDQWRLGDPVQGVENASFGTYSSRVRRYYVLNEQTQGRVGIYDKDWRPKGDVSSLGAAPCYVALSPSERHLAVANYMTGDIVVFAIAGDGGLEAPIVRQNAGSGPNKERQEGPHAHWVQFAPDTPFIYSVDLGTDQVLGYSFDETTGAVGPAFTAFQAPGGNGPRHLVFHPNGRTAFLVAEMGNQVHVLARHSDGSMSVTQSLSTLPEGYRDHSQAAHIVLNKAANTLYISNRGHNSIAVFSVATDGHLELVQIQSTTGNWPRFFLLLEDHNRLVVAHQNGGDLVVFSVTGTGKLESKDQRLKVPQPVFIGRSI